MIKNEQEFRQAIRTILLSDDGLSIESEGDVYVRVSEGKSFFAGLLDSDGRIQLEHEYGEDVDAAIDYFCRERSDRNHGSEF